MWDVKFLTNVVEIAEGFWFYLNYVGCKGDSRRGMDIHRSQFYLNYVGCKVKSAKKIYTVYNKSFTLTMWDVKFS